MTTLVRTATAFDLFWYGVGDAVRAVMETRARYLVATLVVATSVLDLVATQTILTIVEQRGFDLSEANPFMAPIVMTWWIWPVRVGIPIVAVLHDLKVRNHTLLVVAASLYAAACAWNLNILWRIQ